jgi:predicted ATP-grasp superfamily ATP-dependent carboligase
MSFAGVFAGGRMLGTVFSRYLRLWPPGAGSVSFSETVDVPGSLAEQVEDFLAGMRWQGIFELELMERGSESFRAIDFNPRLYGSVALGARAGVWLSSIWCDWLSGNEGAARTARAGFHYRWEDAELRNMIAYLRGRRLRAATSVVRPRRRCAHAFFRWNDPGPLLARALRLGRRYSEIKKNRNQKVVPRETRL